MKKKLSVLVAMIMIFSLLFPSMQGIQVSAAENLKLQMKTTGLLSPNAKFSPVNIKVNETLYVGAEVADDSGYEVTDEDIDFGDEVPRYTKIQWKSDNDNIYISGNDTTNVTFTGKKVGKSIVEVTYKDKSLNVKPLKIEVNISDANAGSEEEANKIVRFEKPSSPITVMMGKTSEKTPVIGYKNSGEKGKVNLVLKNNKNPDLIDVAIDGDKYIVTGKKEGTATFILGEKSNPDLSATIIVNVKDPSPWIFDASTNTLNGTKEKNNPEDFEIPASINGVPVKHIGKNAFRFSTYDNKLNNRIKTLKLPEGIETTQYMSFQGNDLSEILIPKSLTTLGERTFWGNDNLKKVVFQDGGNIQSLGTEAFGNTGISKINIPKTVKKIGDGAFNGTMISSIEIPDTVEDIGTKAFAFTTIEEITIPASVKSLNKDSRGREGSYGIFMRTAAKKKAPGTNIEKGDERFVKVYDKSGLATAENTSAVVNPQPVTIKFVDEQGKKLKDDILAVGSENNKVIEVPGKYRPEKKVAEGDGHYYLDYMNPFGSEVFTNKEIGKSIIGGNYYVDNKEFTFKPDKIKGYEAPENITKTITKEDNQVTFVYPRANKVKLTLEGEGLSSSLPAEQVYVGEKTTISITEPSNKDLKSVTVNDVDVTKKLSQNGVAYSYELELKEDTVVKVIYSESAKENKLEIKPLEKPIQLGDEVDIKAMYRGEKLTLGENLIVDQTAIGGNFKFDEKDHKLIALKAGEFDIPLYVKGAKEYTSQLKVTVKPLNVTVRLEDDLNTVLVKTPVTIDSLIMEKGKDYYTELTFDQPVPIIAISKALQSMGVNTGDKEQFDCISNGSWMKVLGKGLWNNINDDGSFMYLVNNKLAPVTINLYKLQEGDNIVVYYDPNWMDGSGISFFENEEYEVNVGDRVEFQLLGVAMTMDGTNPEPKPIEGANIVADDGVNGVSENTTDKNGIGSLSFDKAGTYYITAIKDGSPAPFSRAFARVVVKEKEDAITPVEPEKPVNPDKPGEIIQPVNPDKPNESSENREITVGKQDDNFKKNTTDAKGHSKHSSPKTGDDAMTVEYLMLLCTALAISKLVYQEAKKHNNL